MHHKQEKKYLLDIMRYTVRFKSMNPRYNIRMYWTNFCQPTNHVKQNIFEQTLIKDISLSLYASFGTFCFQIGQLFESQWVFQECKSTNRHFRRKISPISNPCECSKFCRHEKREVLIAYIEILRSLVKYSWPKSGSKKSYRKKGFTPGLLKNDDWKGSSKLSRKGGSR